MVASRNNLFADRHFSKDDNACLPDSGLVHGSQRLSTDSGDSTG
ncbi:hypothetical protein [Acaryochloris sp. CCMEE 5410]|nr:hypothetical protein [Acaryochloris sp. CCMEE 5410]